MTAAPETNRAWLRKLVTGVPHMVIGAADDPYLLRWYMIPRNPFVNVYLHKFLRSDDDRALHDHPWWFVSLILRGAYAEVTEEGERERGPMSIAFRPATLRHRVRLFEQFRVVSRDNGVVRTVLEPVPCWTLIVTGRRSRTWGFWCKYRRDEHPTAAAYAERFVPWQEFGPGGCGEL